MSEENTKFVIGGVEYDVVKRGFAQAKQISAATRFLAKHGAPALRKLSDGDFEKMGGFELIVEVLSSLDENALVELFQLAFGMPRSAAEEEFDINILVDGLTATYNYSPSIRKLIDRFFSPTSSEGSEDSSSTQSEQPTDG